MSKLNGDVLYLIFKEFQDSKKTLHSCLLVNKTWCEIIIQILWINPWKYLKYGKEKSLLNVIISHLSDESRNNFSLKNNFLINTYQRPLFNYISFCKHLNFCEIERMSNMLYEVTETSIIKNEIFNLFINENTKFTHLYIPCQFDYQIHLIPGAKYRFSELDSVSCNTSINNDVLDGLIEICGPIKELKLFVERYNNNYGFVKLIKSIKRLSNIQLLTEHYSEINDKPFCKIIENSLIHHAETVQYFATTVQPVTKIISSFVNLKRLELNKLKMRMITTTTWNHFESLSLPFLEILKASNILHSALTSLIENTIGDLTVIKIDYVDYDIINNKRIIQAIYQNCPKLENFKLLIMNNNISELENLLINCQCLNKLHILLGNSLSWDDFDYWNNVFEILTKSSSIRLFKFKISSHFAPRLESLKSFFDSWKGRHPMLLKLSHYSYGWIEQSGYNVLTEEYKAEGIIKHYKIHNKLNLSFTSM